MKALRCEYCGGFIDLKTYKCPYCGTQYEKPRNTSFDTRPLLVVQTPAKVITLGAEKILTKEDISCIEKYSLEPLEQLLLKGFSESYITTLMTSGAIELYSDFDLELNAMRYRSKLRVLNPDFRF